MFVSTEIIGIGTSNGFILFRNHYHSYSLMIWKSLLLVYIYSTPTTIPKCPQSARTTRWITVAGLHNSPQWNPIGSVPGTLLSSRNSSSMIVLTPKMNSRYSITIFNLPTWSYLQRNMGNRFFAFQLLQYHKAYRRRREWMLTANCTYSEFQGMVVIGE